MPEGRFAFLGHLLSADDKRVASVVVASMLVLLVMLGLEVFVVTVEHKDFDPVVFAGAAAIVLGVMGGTQTIRDRWSNPGTTPPADNPERQ